MPCALHWDLGDIVAMLGSSFLSILVPVFSKPLELRIRILRTHLCLQVANGTTHFSGCLLLVFKVRLLLALLALTRLARSAQPLCNGASNMSETLHMR